MVCSNVGCRLDKTGGKARVAVKIQVGIAGKQPGAAVDAGPLPAGHRLLGHAALAAVVAIPIVELVGPDGLPPAAQHGILPGFQLDVAKTAQFLLPAAAARNEPRHGPQVALAVFHGLVQGHKPAAFGQNGHALLVGPAHCLPQRPVPAEGLAVELRVAAPQVQGAAALRQPVFFQRAKRDQPGAQLFQQFQIFRVIKAEGLVLGQGNGRPGVRHRRHLRQGPCQRRRAAGQGQQALHVHRLFRLGGQAPHLLFQVCHLGRRHQAQVAALQGTLGQRGQIPQGRDAQLPLQHRGQGFVGHGAAPVQDHAGAAAVRPEIQQPPQGGGQGQGGPFGLCHQHHRRFQHLGHVIGAGLGGAAPHAVVKAHHPFYHSHAAAFCPFQKQAPGQVFPGEIQVQVPAFGADDAAVEHGVDVIGAALEGSGRQAPLHKGLEQGAGHCGLAAAAAGGGQHQAGDLSHGRRPPPAG